jgi:hypothetical protein
MLDKWKGLTEHAFNRAKRECTPPHKKANSLFFAHYAIIQQKLTSEFRNNVGRKGGGGGSMEGSQAM